ncbi:unnamed protein product [Danaus chrysippus]|uniref:(African queen) hypothetical protein n=1 Tax=Danaus chrysippus TaxID=151541 RepID=A0A8J2QNY9_9NEOP|nr:unnamed protein product [Danaus chrysippus]
MGNNLLSELEYSLGSKTTLLGLRPDWSVWNSLYKRPAIISEKRSEVNLSATFLVFRRKASQPAPAPAAARLWRTTTAARHLTIIDPFATLCK